MFSSISAALSLNRRFRIEKDGNHTDLWLHSQPSNLTLALSSVAINGLLVLNGMSIQGKLFPINVL